MHFCAEPERAWTAMKMAWWVWGLVGWGCVWVCVSEYVCMCVTACVYVSMLYVYSRTVWGCGCECPLSRASGGNCGPSGVPPEDAGSTPSTPAPAPAQQRMWGPAGTGQPLPHLGAQIQRNGKWGRRQKPDPMWNGRTKNSGAWARSTEEHA